MFSPTVALTYLDDEENARQAYEQAVNLEARDPSVCLNYAIFHHNHKDKVGVIAFVIFSFIYISWCCEPRAYFLLRFQKSHHK